MSFPPDPSALVRESLQKRFPEIEILEGRGGWIVGGAVRDVLLARDPVDCDLVFDDARGEAERFGAHFRRRPAALGKARAETWIVTIDERRYEFTATTRGSIEADLGRRDFTINAMALSLDDGRFLDMHGGMSDLRQGLLRQIDERNFVDDPLRVLKGIRSSAELGFQIEELTFDAMKRQAPGLETVAAERVLSELLRALDADAFHALRLIDALGLRPLLRLPETALTEVGHRGTYSLAAADVLAILFRSTRYEEIGGFLERWKAPGSMRATLEAQRRLAATLSDSPSDCELAIALHDAGAIESRRLARIDAENRARVLDLMQSNREIFETRDLLDGDELRDMFGMHGKAIGLWKRRLLEARICGLVVDREAAVEFVRTRSGEELDVDTSESDGDFHAR